MKASLIALCALSSAVIAVASGCSSDESDDDGSAGAAAVGGGSGKGGSAGDAGSGGSSGSGKGGSGGSTGGSSGKGGAGGTTGGSSGSSGTGTTGGSAGTGGSSGDAGATSGEAGSGSGADGGAAGGTATELVGVCAHRGDGTVTTDEFSGFEEYYLIGDEGFGDEICIVRFDVTRVGPAPEGCTGCLWSHLVELSNPSVVADENGVCGSSELALDSDAIAALDGSQVAYGFVPELDGHVSIVLTHNATNDMWEPYNSATWDETTGRFRFDRRNGFCSY